MKKVNGVWQTPCAEEYRKVAREWLLFQKRTVPEDSVDDKMIDIILRLINLDQEALKNLEGLEAEWVCDEMGGCEWCSEHCNSGAGARKECWEHYLLYGKDGE